MAKGQKRSSKEVRKPKKGKAKPLSPTASFKPGMRLTDPEQKS